MKQKSIKNIRQEFKDNGIFYTPFALAEKLKSYVDVEPKLENTARKAFLDKLRKELDFEKMVCKMEGISIQPFINSIKKIVREYDEKSKPEIKPDNQMTMLEDHGVCPKSGHCL